MTEVISIQPKKGRIAIKVLAVLMLVGVLFEGCLMLGVYVAGALPRRPVRSDALVVLGARVMPGGNLSTTLEHRVERALEVYRDGFADYVIVCGAQGADEPVSEADAMAEYLIQNGVPGERVLRDPDSCDTVQNIQNAMALMEQHALQTAIIVTSEYHLTRALWIARDQGLSATGVPAPGPNLRRNRIKANFHETLSWMNYFTGGLFERVLGLGKLPDDE